MCKIETKVKDDHTVAVNVNGESGRIRILLFFNKHAVTDLELDLTAMMEV